MSSYKHYKYLSDNFPDRIKKARENKIVKKEVFLPKSSELLDDEVLLVKTNLLSKDNKPKQLKHKGKH